MTRQYQGVCVGGPLAGKMVSNDDRSRFYVNGDGTVVGDLCGECGQARTIPPHIREREYRFIQIGDPGGFWLWHDMLITQGVNALAEAYVARETGRGNRR